MAGQWLANTERVPCNQGGVTAAGPSPNLTEFPIKHLKISMIFLNQWHLNLFRLINNNAYHVKLFLFEDDPKGINRKRHGKAPQVRPIKSLRDIIVWG